MFSKEIFFLLINRYDFTTEHCIGDLNYKSFFSDMEVKVMIKALAADWFAFNQSGVENLNPTRIQNYIQQMLPEI